MIAFRARAGNPLQWGMRAAVIHSFGGPEVLQIEEGTLYPALGRLLLKGWVKAEWRRTENNRRARYYRLTPAGRRQLELESSTFERLMGAMVRVMEAS